MTPLEVLKTYWGHDSFRPLQEEIIRSALEDRDVLALLPTGGGKSVCFQVPALMKEGLCLVVTPLIALMKDQVQNLAQRGIKALAIHAGMGRHEVDLTLNNAAYGDFQFLYVSPERLNTRLFRSYLDVLPLNFIVVDEAHCISQWGYDFRPDYLRIGELRKLVDVPVIALTATATPRVAGDIMDKLGFREPLLLKASFERPNLTYLVRKVDDKLGQLLNICRSVPGSGIVYMRHRARCEEIASYLQANGIAASYYHAGLSALARTERQARWKEGELPVMVCTNAFGMGIDKSDVRFVVHMDLPESVEAYYQEAGRAGRDGNRSYAVLLWNDADVRRLRQIEKTSFPSLEFIEDIYQKLHQFYQVPYETGAGRQLKYEAEEFCRHFKLQRAAIHYALKYLEQTDHITYAEDIETDTKVKITVDRNALYDIELPERGMAEVLELLMRSYPGIFSFAVGVDEKWFSGKLGISVPALRQLLYKLSLEHVIRYIPTDRTNVIQLHHDRLRPGNLALSPEMYERLHGTWQERAEAVIAYASEEDTCRSRFLVSYFGQEEAAACGTCDVCRAGRNRPATDSVEKTLRAFVDAKGGQYTLDELNAFLADPANGLTRHALEILRRLIDEGELPPPL